MTTSSKSTASDFVKEIVVNCASLGLHTTKSSKATIGLDGYFEFYVFSTLIRHMEKQGYQTYFFNLDSGGNFVIAMNKHDIYSSEFSYVQFVRDNCNKFTCKEAHISLGVIGESGVEQELDVAMLAINHADYCRLLSMKAKAVDIDVSKDRSFRNFSLAVECKLHHKASLSHARSIITTCIDMKADLTLLVTSYNSEASNKLIKHYNENYLLRNYSSGKILCLMEASPKTSTSQLISLLRTRLN